VLLRSEFKPIRKLQDVPAHWNSLTEIVIGAAMEVHSSLGPGLLERNYELALCHELSLRKISHARQVPISISYKGAELGRHVLDLVVDNLLVVEIKSVETVHDVFLHQLVSYMHTGRFPLGLLFNFNVHRLKDGLYRRVLAKHTPIPDSFTADS
jgi:GxxExxY protein